MLHLWGRSSGAHNNVRIYLRVAIILGLLFALAGPFAKVAYADEESPEGTPSPPTETSTEEISPPTDEQNSSEEAVEIDEPVDTIGEETEPEKELAPDNSDAGADEADAGEADVGEASSEEPPEEGVQADEPDNDPVEESTAKISVPDPYFYVDGDKHSFLPEGGDCADATNCQVSTTPIQDALDAVSGGLTPDGNTIYIEGGIYEEDFSINNLSDLTLQGAADDSPSILAGVVSVVDSFNIALRDLIFGEVILVRDSTDVTITGTEGDDEIEVELNGTVEAVSVKGGAGSDILTINTDEDIGLGLADNQISFDENIESVTVNVSGDNHEVEVAGEVNVPGGDISINNPGGDVIVSSSGAIDVSGEDGGRIEINAERIASFGTLTADGQGDPSSGSGHGGVINVLASDIVVIGNDARLTANAGLIGDGGEILVIGERHATIASSATLEAKGGSQGGGGFIETSSYQSFDIGAIPDMSASNGQAGTWLLDPANNIEVITGSTNTNVTENPAGVFNTDRDGAKIGVDNILTALGNGDVTITTGTADNPSESGNVTWNADLTYTGTTTRTLTINAIGNIIINKIIKATAAKLNVLLNADSDTDGTGYVDIQDDITSNGGDITIQGYDVGFNGRAEAGSGNITLQPSIDVLVGFGIGGGGGFYIAEVEFA